MADLITAIINLLKNPLILAFIMIFIITKLINKD